MLSICKALISVPGTWSMVCVCLYYDTHELDHKVVIKIQLHAVSSWCVVFFIQFIYLSIDKRVVTTFHSCSHTSYLAACCVESSVLGATYLCKI